MGKQTAPLRCPDLTAPNRNPRPLQRRRRLQYIHRAEPGDGIIGAQSLS